MARKLTDACQFAQGCWDSTSQSISIDVQNFETIECTIFCWYGTNEAVVANAEVDQTS